MTEGKRENCKTCLNYDSGHCIAKEEYDFFNCDNDEAYEPEGEENDSREKT